RRRGGNPTVREGAILIIEIGKVALPVKHVVNSSREVLGLPQIAAAPAASPRSNFLSNKPFAAEFARRVAFESFCNRLGFQPRGHDGMKMVGEHVNGAQVISAMAANFLNCVLNNSALRIG